MAMSLQDLLTALQNGVTAINGVSRALLGQGNCFVAGDVTAINSLSTTAITVIAADTDRAFLVFHNPSSGVTVYVSPSISANGAGLTPIATSPGGTFRIIPMDFIQFSGGCQTSWLAVASSGTGQPLTVVSF